MDLTGHYLNLKSTQIAIVATVLLYILPLTTAWSEPNDDSADIVNQMDKRDPDRITRILNGRRLGLGGYKLYCSVNPRNCNSNRMDKRGDLLEYLSAREPSESVISKDDLSPSRSDTEKARLDLIRSLLRLKQLGLMPSSSTKDSNDENESRLYS